MTTGCDNISSPGSKLSSDVRFVMAISFVLMSAAVNSDKQNQLYVAVHFVTLGSTCVAHTFISDCYLGVQTFVSFIF
jgi:hypothetical protein